MIDAAKALALAVLASAFTLALATPAGAQTRDDIMERVIWPCVDHEVAELDLQEHHAEPAATIMFELDRDFYEDVIDAVEEALREHTDDNEAWIYEAGLAACIQNQGSWPEEPPEEPLPPLPDGCDVDSDVPGCPPL